MTRPIRLTRATSPRTRLALCTAALLLLLAAATTGTTACSSSAGQRQHDELAVERVVLYQNGIGYFERRGQTTGRELALQIRPDQINDLLGSLTVIDRRGGHVASISLPVEKSASMILGELPAHVRDAGGLLAVLSAFRGARVDIDYSGGSAEGRIVGVESSEGAEGREEWRVTVLTDDDELVPIRLDAIERVELGDRTLTVGLDRALDVALGEGDWKPVDLAVHFPDDGPHDVVMSYVVAMPTWKPAYRIIFSKGKGEGAAEDARLQGWAVVDNVSGEDWDGVELSLTAGAPISFVVDLHTPRLVTRPDLTHRTWSSYAEAPPDALEGFVAPADPEPEYARSEAAPSRPSSTAKRKAKKDMAAGGGKSADDYGYDYDESLMDESEPMDGADYAGALPESASGERLGALFRYDIPVPVTVPDGSSALVTIINESIEAEDVLLYDPSSGSARAWEHPYRSVRLANTTNFVIERGPLTIYKDSTFVGEGITAQIGQGETVFVPYALESGIHVEQHAVGGGALEQRLIKIKDGVVTVESAGLQKTQFTVTNKLGESGTLYVRVDKLPGHELREPQTAIAQGEVYFVPIPLEAASSSEPVEMIVVQSSKAQRTLALYDPSLRSVLELYIADADADPAVTTKLEVVLDLQRQLAAITGGNDALAERQSQLRARADDLRRNIRVLGESAANKKLRDELVLKLGAVDDELSEIDRQLVQANEQRYSLEVQISEAFQQITLEP